MTILCALITLIAYFYCNPNYINNSQHLLKAYCGISMLHYLIQPLQQPYEVVIIFPSITDEKMKPQVNMLSFQ